MAFITRKMSDKPSYQKNYSCEVGSVGKKKSGSKTVKRIVAENAIMKIAEREGVSAEYVKKQIQIAMLNGLCSTDPKIKAFWDAVPCEKVIPTPEELILYISETVRRKRSI